MTTTLGNGTELTTLVAPTSRSKAEEKLKEEANQLRSAECRRPYELIADDTN
jgi:hypothetical protein